MDREGVSCIEMVGAKDKRLITAVFYCTLLGDFLPVQLIYKGKTSRCHPRFQFPSGWHVTHAPKHWSTEQTMIEYIRNIIFPYVQLVRELKQNDNTVAEFISEFVQYLPLYPHYPGLSLNHHQTILNYYPSKSPVRHLAA